MLPFNSVSSGLVFHKIKGSSLLFLNIYFFVFSHRRKTSSLRTGKNEGFLKSFSLVSPFYTESFQTFSDLALQVRWCFIAIFKVLFLIIRCDRSQGLLDEKFVFV